MKQATAAGFILVLIISIALVACNNETKKEEPVKTDESKTETPTMPTYDPAMDPIKVESNVLSKIFADTLGVKFYEIDIKPGDSVGMHVHPDHLIYVLDGGMTQIMSKGGTWQPFEFKTGMGVMAGPDTHTGKNTGTTTIKLLVADIYRPRN